MLYLFIYIYGVLFPLLFYVYLYIGSIDDCVTRIVTYQNVLTLGKSIMLIII